MQGHCCVCVNLPLSKCHLNFNSLYLSKDPRDNLALLHFHHLEFFPLFVCLCFTLCLANRCGALWATLTRCHLGHAPIEFIAASVYELFWICINVCMLSNASRRFSNCAYWRVINWGRRPDGVSINEARKIGYILEFKRSTDRDEGFLKGKDAEANEHHKSVIGALTDTFIVFYLFVLHSVTCLKTCYFTAYFTSRWTSISVFLVILHMKSSRFCLYWLNIYHFTYTFWHAHTEAHTHKHTCTISTQKEWRQPGTGAEAM